VHFWACGKGGILRFISGLMAVLCDGYGSITANILTRYSALR
jgi:hypothetical protein